jgi:hypothetical protein
MESEGDIHARISAALGNVKISPSGMTVMGDGKSTNKTGRDTAYPAVGAAENSRSIVLTERNTARKTFLVAFWDWVYGVLALLLYLNAEHPCGGSNSYDEGKSSTLIRRYLKRPSSSN